uniref:Growth differentiation factor 2 n=1 Tax=Salvator merianae TaxID=96440 RepID=A0A8D0KP95_SALMN
MYCLGALAVLNSIIIHLTSIKPMEVQGKLLITENSHKYYQDFGNMKEEVHFAFKAFLENLKSNLLRNLNLSKIPSQERMKEEPLRFMIDLYNQYTKDKSSSPISNIVRSFSPKDIASHSTFEMDPFQKYILLFNVSLPWHEEVSRAELRIHTACQKETECFSSRLGNMVIYDEHLQENHWEKTKDAKSFIVSQRIQQCGWVTFDVSSAVKRWLKAEKARTATHLEIAVENHFTNNHTCGKLHISMNTSSSHLPLLIVFSNDPHNSIKKNMGLWEIMASEQEKSVLKNLIKNKQNTLSVNTIHHFSSRSKRSVEITHCRRTSLRVNFREIGWNWIIAPQDYEAFECKGGCFFPLTENVTPTKHAIVQTLVHYKNPKKTSKACCVPTKLDAISMLYKDDAGIPTLKLQYEGMQVAECGCR